MPIFDEKSLELLQWSMCALLPIATGSPQNVCKNLARKFVDLFSGGGLKKIGGTRFALPPDLSSHLLVKADYHDFQLKGAYLLIQTSITLKSRVKPWITHVL